MVNYDKLLRASILKAAVKGTLIPQNPHDEPASVLLERVRKERARLIQEGKIRKPRNGDSIITTKSDGSVWEQRGKKDPVDISNQIPFAIPSNWAWARFTQYVGIQYGFAAKSNKFDPDASVRLIRIRDVNSGDLIHTSTGYVGKYSPEYIVHHGDYLIGMDGKFQCRKWQGDNALLNQRVCRLVFNNTFVEATFVAYVLNFYLNAINRSTSKTTVKHLSAKALDNLLFAVPPLIEQRRIAIKLEQIYPKIHHYTVLNSNLKQLDSHAPLMLRASILKAAVKGTLIPQNPHDEPASVLLERVRKERARLIQEGKIRKPRNGDSIITTKSDGSVWEQRGKKDPVDISNQIPFAIPSNWAWARFTQYVGIQYGFAAKSNKFDPDASVRLIRIRDVNSGDLIHTSTGYVGKYSPEYIVHHGDYLIGMDGKFQCRKWQGDNALLNQRVCRLVFNNTFVEATFVAYVLNFYLNAINRSTSKTTVKHLSAKALDNLLFAVPPLIEQRRIAIKLEQIYPKIHKIDDINHRDI